MTWMDASEAFVMELAARDRVDELQTTVDVEVESGGGADPAPCEVRKTSRWMCGRMAAARA